jgi:hypothetical protein
MGDGCIPLWMPFLWVHAALIVAIAGFLTWPSRAEPSGDDLGREVFRAVPR